MDGDKQRLFAYGNSVVDSAYSTYKHMVGRVRRGLNIRDGEFPGIEIVGSVDFDRILVLHGEALYHC